MSLWLTAEELVELTGYKNRKKQKIALGQMGLKFLSRPSDGFPLVHRWQFEGEIIRPASKSRSPTTEPDFAALRELTNKKR